ncbi:MAG: hypothetical protein WKF62_08640 [Solirubrobacterales bacterium]
MSFEPKKFLVLLAMIAALLVAGCGGDDEGDSGESSSSGEPLSEEDYAVELGEVLEPLGTELEEVGAATSSGTDEEAVEGVSSVSDSLESSISDLEGITPPENVADAHEAMIASLGEFQEAADEFASTDPSDQPALQDAEVALQESAGTFQTNFASAISEIQSAGIEPPTP